MDYDWADQAPPAAPLIVDAIRSDKYSDTFTLHIMDGDQDLHPPSAQVSLLLARAPAPGLVLTDAESDLYLVLAVTK